MVGRLDKKLILQGVGSSGIWRGEIERRNVPVGLPIALQDDSYLPTDANAFYLRGVPILSAFTGSHSEYHTPRDKPETLNYDGAAKISRLMALIARSLATRDAPPDYIAQAPPKSGTRGPGCGPIWARSRIMPKATSRASSCPAWPPPALPPRPASRAAT